MTLAGVRKYVPVIAPYTAASTVSYTNAGAMSSVTNHSTTTAQLGNGTLFAVPVLVGAKFSSTYVGVYVATGNANEHLYAGLYLDDGGKPGTRIAYNSSQASLTTGSAVLWVAWATAATVYPGLYWVGLVQDGTNATLRAFPGKELYPVIGAVPGSNGYPIVHGTRSFTYAACPDPWGTVSTWASNAASPAVWIY